MTAFKRAMTYLGLGPDEDYDDVVPAPEPVAPPPADSGGGVRTLTRTATPTAAPAAAAPPTQPQRAAAPRQEAQPQPRVRPLAPPQAAVEVVQPRNFNDAQLLADVFKASKPVIMNLQGSERDLSRRMIDFTSGLCYGLGGRMERVADNVYLLTPDEVEVSAEEKRRLADRGLID